MKFGSIPVAEAVGAVLAHSLRAGTLAWRKGRILSAADIATLADNGITQITGARLEPGDLSEDQAASRVARAAMGEDAHHVRAGAAFTGRVNLYARQAGLLLVDSARIDALNALDEAITLASLPPFARVSPRQMLATIKIIPFAAPESAVAMLETRLAGAPPLRLAPFTPHRVALISTILPTTKPGLLDKGRAALEARLAGLGSQLTHERHIPHETQALADALKEAVVSGADPILVSGARAIADRRDTIPAALELAGGTITQFGMPVDPGNLLLAGRLAGKTVLGLPGCARSPKRNGFDFVLWRVLAGLPLDRADITAMGVGGLLNDIPARPHPRDGHGDGPPDPQTQHLPRIGAIVLAAGTSSRMKADGGANKLLRSGGGQPMIRHAVEAALESAASPVIVVTGNENAQIAAALTGLSVIFCDNPDFSKGLSTSLISGLNALPRDCDGALILLGDMPGVDTPLLDRLIAAFDPREDRTIIVPAHGGRHGNPVLWASRFFPEMRGLTGDTGARALLARYPDLICEVEADGDAPFTDIDTAEAMAAWRARTGT